MTTLTSSSENRLDARSSLLARAWMLAQQSHVGQRTRFGEPVIEHVERVAAAVPPKARATALLHEFLERSPVSRRKLRGAGIGRVELAALQLLTHAPGESYEDYVRRIADATGQAGQLARTVKLADLEDHLSHALIPAGAPRYAWAREQLLTRRDRPPCPPSQQSVPPDRRYSSLFS
jgi:hypothetical protein